MNPIVYRVDQTDRLTFINSSWFMFAEKNGIQMRESSILIGTRLWQHVSDCSVRHFYAVFMAKVRKTGKSITLPFRCDSPELMRSMEMTISKHNDDELEFRTILLSEDPHNSVKPPASSMAKTAPLIMMCLWCKNVKATRWIRPEQAVRELNLFETSSLPLVSHVTCPRCESKGLTAIME